jgi:hypothetical protein
MSWQPALCYGALAYLYFLFLLCRIFGSGK